MTTSRAVLAALALSLCLAWPAFGQQACPQAPFMNRDYSPGCVQSLPDSGAPETMTVRQGAFETAPGMGAVYFEVQDVTCAPLLGGAQGAGQALVKTVCGFRGANYSLLELFVFAGPPQYETLLDSLDNERVHQDYERFHEAETLWPLQDVAPVRDAGGTVLEALFYADGAHCCPEKEVRMRYGLKDGSLTLLGEPRVSMVEQEGS